MSILCLGLLLLVLPCALLIFLMNDAFKGFGVRCIYYGFVVIAIISLALPSVGLYHSLK